MESPSRQHLFIPFSMLALGGIAAALLQLPLITMEKGFSSGIRERSLVVIKTQKELEDLWRAHKGGTSSQRQIQAVDFEKEMIVAAFLGEKRTGGYGIEITKAEEDSQNGRLNIFFRETRPPPNSMVIQALTQPYHIVKLKKIDLPPVFVPDG